MRSRRSRAAVLDPGRAADTISDLADQAVTLARGAGSAALPTVQRSAEGLSQVFQTAAGTLADTAGQIASDSRVTAAGNAARERIADASGKLSTAIRPKKKTHRVRNLLIGAAVVGGVFALIQSPLRTKIQERLFGPPPSDGDDLPQITLPDEDRHVQITDLTQGSKAEPDSATDVVGTPVAAEPAPRGGRSHGHNHEEPTDNQETNA